MFYVMEGGQKRKTRGNLQQNLKMDDKPSNENEDASNEASNLAGHIAMEAIQANIISEIQGIRSDMKKELGETVGLLKKELVDFRIEVNQKLNSIGSNLKEVTGRVEETERRVAEMEEWSTEAKQVLSHVLELQENTQAQLTELEARSRRNNIRIHGIAEGAEGDNMEEFLEKFITTELSPLNTTLDLQRCHRSLGPKPPQGSNPRSIVVCFQEYKTKELVLRSAWKKKEIHHGGKRVFFEQDYPPEILRKRKAFSTIRKALKEKGLRFQTLYPAKLRVFFDNGPAIYNNASEAREDLRKRGMDSLDVEVPERGTLATRMKQLSWEIAGGTSRRHREARLMHIQEKLKGFRHRSDTTQELPNVTD